MNASARFATAILLLASLAGCAVGPDFSPPKAAVPARWSDGTGSQHGARSGWWRDFRDPVLDKLVADAVAGSLNLATSKAKVREARASRRQSLGGLFPTVSASSSADRSRTAQSAAAGTLYQAGFDASWELDLFGANARALEAADGGSEAAEADLDATVLTLLGDVVSNYVEARGYDARIDLARRTAKAQRRTADLVRVSFGAGSSSGADTAKADALAASTESAIPDLETSRAEAVHRLAVLTGKTPGSLNAIVGRSANVPSPSVRLQRGVPAKVVEGRPDVQAAMARYAQSVAKVGQAEANLYPTASLIGSLSTSASKPGDLAKASSISWSYGPSVTVPIFSGGSLTAARDIAGAQRDEQLIAWKASVLAALEDVENASVGLSQSRVKVSDLSRATAAYRRSDALSLTLYKAGSASFLDFLDAERSLYSSEDSMIQARVAVALQHVALAKALGGGIGARIDISKPEVVDHDVGPRPRGI